MNLIMFLIFFIKIVQQGKIYSLNSQNIIPSLSNEKEIVDYQFIFYLENEIENGFLEIIFPLQFKNPFHQSSCPDCTFLNNKLIFEIKQKYEAGKPQTQTIQNVTNPQKKLGTSNFIIRTKQGNNTIDESKIFGKVGIWEKIQELTSTTISIIDNSAFAGESNQYSFSFKLPQDSVKNITIEIYLPKSTFIVSDFPSCESFAINNYQVKGKLICQYKNDTLFVNGFEENMPKGSMIGIILRMGNPKYSLVTLDFNIYIFLQNTKSALFYKKNIPGISISPGKISQIKLFPKNKGIKLTKNKIVWMRLSFKLKNSLPEDSSIKIIFPSSFKLYKNPEFILDRPWSYYIESGLEDKDSKSVIKINYYLDFQQDNLIITNFKEMASPGEISLLFLCQMPNNQGKTSSFEIQSYQNNEIDLNITDTFTIIENINKPNNHQLVISNLIADGESVLDLQFTIAPSLQLLQNFRWEIKIDPNFSLKKINTSNCLIQDNVTLIYSEIGNCYTQDDQFIIISKKQLDLGINYQIQINNALVSPLLSGSYLLEINIYQNDILQQSWSEINQFQPQSLNNLSANIFPKYKNQQSVIDIQFDINYKLEQSPLELQKDQIISFILLQFEGTAVTEKDLGMGIDFGETKEIPCKSTMGLLPLEGNSITCIMTAGTLPQIKITNYQKIEKNFNLKFLIPNIKNPNGTWDFIIQCVLQKQQKYTILSKSVISKQTNYNLPNGLESNLVDDPEIFYNVSQKQIDSFFNIQFQISDFTVIQQNSKIIVQLPTFDTGFLVKESYIACNVNNDYYQCHHFPGIDWIYIEINQQITPVPLVSFFWLRNLKWPSYVLKDFPLNKNIFRFISSNSEITKIINYPYFLKSQESEIYDISIRIDKRERQNVDVEYMFKFKQKTTIPLESTIIISFPDEYNLFAPFPALTIHSPEIYKYSKNTQIYEFTQNQIIIKNVPKISENLPIRVFVYGVRNPDTTNILSGWKIQIQKNDNLVSEINNFSNFYLMSTFQPKRVQINSINIFPTNKNLLSQFIFNLSFQTKLRKDAEIFIIFPINFQQLPSYFGCEIRGAIQTFQSCVKQGNKFVIKLQEDYISGEIIIKLDNIRNPIVDQTNPFVFYSKYDSSIVDESKLDSESKRVISFTNQPKILIIKQFSINPITESLSSIYSFQIKPTEDISEQQQIVIIFPFTFDQNLGNDIQLQILKGLQGQVKYKISERKLFIYNFQKYFIENDIIYFQIKGIVNPIKPKNGDSGIISIGILKENKTEFVEFQENAGIVDLMESPLPLDIKLFESDNLYSRLKQNIKIQILLEKKITKINQIILKLPKEFKKIQQIKNCKVNLVYQNCNQEDDDIFIDIDQDFEGSIDILIQDIDNPQDDILTSQFIIKIYNKFYKNIEYMTYSNLNSLSLEYKFPGPKIIINQNEPIFVEKGSYSKFLILEIEKICQLDLQIISKQIQIEPEIIHLKIGEKQKQFRISIPFETIEETLELQLLTIGDDIPIYTPIRLSYINLTNKMNLPILVQEINEIPLNGSSLGIRVQIPFAPETGIDIRLKFQQEYNYIQLNTTALSFQSGEIEKYFEIKSTTDQEIGIFSGKVELDVLGVNSNIYQIEKSTLNFNIIEDNTRRPEILELKISKKDQISAEIFFTISEISVAYYVNALKYTAVPSFEEILDKRSVNIITTQSQFGILQIGPDLQGNIKISNLLAETEYVIYIYLKNRSNELIEIPAILEYKTDNKYNSSQGELIFYKNYINSAEKKLIQKEIAFLMSLRDYKIQQSEFDFNQEKKESEQVGTISSYQFDILPEPLSNVYPSTVELAEELENNKNYLKQKFSSFDENQNISVYEFVRYDVNFSENPKMINVQFNFAEFTFKLDNYGWIFAVSLKKIENFGEPSPFQISQFYNEQNLPKIGKKVKIDQKFQEFGMRVDGLEQNTEYLVFFTAGNAHPGYSDLMDKDNTVVVNVQTPQAPEIPYLSLEFGGVLGVYCFLLFN